MHQRRPNHEEAPLLVRAFTSMRGCLIARMAIVLGAVIFTVILHLLPRRVVNMAALMLLAIVLSMGNQHKEDRNDSDDYAYDVPDATSDDGLTALTYCAAMLIFLSHTVTALLICNFVVEDVIPAYVNHLNATAQALARLGLAPAPLDVTDENDESDKE